MPPVWRSTTRQQGSCVLKASVVECWSILWIDSLDWSLIDPQSTLNWCSIDTSLDTWSTHDQHSGQQLVESQIILVDMPSVSIDAYELVNTRPTINWLSIDCQLRRWLSAIQVSAEYQFRCRSSVNRDVDQVLIEGQLRVNQGSIKGIDQHLTVDDFSTHDPTTEHIHKNLQVNVMHGFCICQSSCICTSFPNSKEGLRQVSSQPEKITPQFNDEQNLCILHRKVKLLPTTMYVN